MMSGPGVLYVPVPGDVRAWAGLGCAACIGWRRMTSSTIPSPARRPSPLLHAGSGLWLPAAVVLLAGLVLLVVGILRVPSSVSVDGAYEIVDLGTAAAISPPDAEVTGRSCLIAGTVLTYLGWAALLVLFVGGRAGAPRRAASHSTVQRLMAATIVLGVALLAVGLVQVPRHHDLSEIFGPVPNNFPEDFLSPSVAVPGRNLMDLGTALVTLGGAGLLMSDLARRRLRGEAAPQPTTA